MASATLSHLALSTVHAASLSSHHGPSLPIRPRSCSSSNRRASQQLALAKAPAATSCTSASPFCSQLSWTRGSLLQSELGLSRSFHCTGNAAAGDSSTTSRRGNSSVGPRRLRVVCPLVPQGIVDAVKKIDENKMGSLALRRVVFGHEDWKKHKSSGRYWRHLRTMFTSKIISALGPPVTVIALIAIFVVFWNKLVLQGALPWAKVLRLSSLPFSLTAPALSFLLVFRTNASYGRFDEARKMWGLMLNRTRDICRQALTYMARGQHAYEYTKRAQFLRHLQAFPLIYKHHLVQEGSLEADLKNLTSLTDAEIQGVFEATHRPNYCLQMMSECMRACHMDPVQRLSMETNLATFADDIGGSERLFKTPIPISYTRLTSRFMMIYHALLPFALWDALGWLTIPATILCTGVFFCIEEVGVLIENPFPILALDVIAQSARNNVAEMISLHEGIRARVVADDNALKQMPPSEQEQMLPHAPSYAPEPDLAYLSDLAEEDGALTSSPSLA